VNKTHYRGTLGVCFSILKRYHNDDGGGRDGGGGCGLSMLEQRLDVDSEGALTVEGREDKLCCISLAREALS